ncbi:MAG: hypothetical protein WCB68_07890 [Pyrinomonadaceae bacterium]
MFAPLAEHLHHAHAAPADTLRTGTSDARHRGQNKLEEITSELKNEDLLDRQSRLEEAERAAEIINQETES